jgi:hypothetical protein
MTATEGGAVGAEGVLAGTGAVEKMVEEMVEKRGIGESTKKWRNLQCLRSTPVLVRGWAFSMWRNLHDSGLLVPAWREFQARNLSTGRCR